MQYKMCKFCCIKTWNLSQYLMKNNVLKEIRMLVVYCSLYHSVKMIRKYILKQRKIPTNSQTLPKILSLGRFQLLKDM